MQGLEQDDGDRKKKKKTVSTFNVYSTVKWRL